METTYVKNHPGIYVPPPMLYVAIFFLSLFLQKLFPLEYNLFNTKEAKIIGWSLVALYLVIFFISLRQFIASKNTIVTINPATSLQTKGIYAYTRNPMYLSLLLLYCGIAVFKGNWWTFILLPILIVVVNSYVIRKEEDYLQHAFGDEYKAYKKKVRRWI